MTYRLGVRTGWVTVLLGVACAMVVPGEPRSTAGERLLDEIGGNFHATHRWFGMVTDLEFDRGPDESLAPRWASLHSPLVIHHDAGGQVLEVTLPDVATGAHTLAVAGNDGVGVTAHETGLLPVRAEVARGVVIYRNALAGGDLLYKLTPTHVDEYIYLRTPPETLHRRITVAPGAAVGGMRAVSSGVEVMDKDGTARLRVAAPLARSADGTRRRGTARVEGNDLVLDIDLRGLVAPVLIDPDWSTTGSMTVGHWADQSFLRADGRVMVVAGCALSGCPTTFARPACGQVLADTEVWAESTGTWSAGPPIATPRFAFAGVPLGTGDFLIAGGCVDTGCATTTPSAELYVGASAVWTDAGALSVARAHGMSASLSDGDALVVGGCDGTACQTTSDRYHPLAGSPGSWAPTASLATARGYGTATALGDGRVLVVGGCGTPDCNPILGDAEVYDPNANRWTPAGTMSSPRAGHTATLLGDGTVLVVGGCADAACTRTLPTTEIWTPDGNFHPGPTMPGARHDHTATMLDTGEVLVAGGANGISTSVPQAEVYAPTQSRWIEMDPMHLDRAFHTAVRLQSHNVMLAGGCNPATCMPWAEVFSPARIPSLLADGGAEDVATDAPNPQAPDVVALADSPHPAMYRTGTTKCATDTVQELACPLSSHPLQDGDFQPNSRALTVSAPGEVTDTVTGLIWQAHDDGVGRTLTDATAYCETLATSGVSAGQWRLPSVTELMTVVDYGTNSPSMDARFTSTTGGASSPAQSTNYWTSTPGASGAGQNWTVKFDFGEVVLLTASRTLPVRCVRGGPSGPPALRQAGRLVATQNTVLDADTGLEWQRTDDGVRRTWQDSLAYCATLNLAGETGWHLPNIDELRGLVEYGGLRNGVAIDPIFEGARADLYWTSTPNDGAPTLSWSVGFNLGVVDGVTVSGLTYARCVRHLPEAHPDAGPSPVATPSGCGCSTPSQGSPRGAGILAVAALALWRRRRTGR